MKLILILLLVSFLSCFECQSKKKLDWWQERVVYQIYPRSFKDSNDDGVGDLKGIAQKLPYLKTLGIGVIWLCPILKSPMVDFGYDVSNFREIDPMFGTMNHFDALIKRAKKLGIKVIMDFVPNHTSTDHEWFEKSVEKIPPYTDYYVWKDASYTTDGKRMPPNNWLSEFGKSAWQWNEVRGQYYLHQFAIEQADLNFRNPVVVEEIKNVIIFWLEKGIDGLRIDSVNFLFEDAQFLDEPRSYLPNVEPDQHIYLKHIYCRNQPESVEMVKEWRQIFDKYSEKPGSPTRFMVTEAYANVEHVVQYYGNKTAPGAHTPFNFLMITDVNRESSAQRLQEVISIWYKNMPADGWANWVLGNHDNPRPATRYGHFLVDGLHMLLMLLPGTPFIYNGDELGMEDAFIRWDETKDPRAINAGPQKYEQFSRDGCRTPFQWDDTENAGFTKSLHTWLPVHPGYWTVNVKAELSVPKCEVTHLHILEELIKLRKNIVFQQGDLNIYVLSKWVLAITRSFIDHATYAVVINLGSEITFADLLKERSSLPREMTVEIPSVNSNYKKGDVVPTDSITLRPKASVVLCTSEEWDIKVVHNSGVHTR